MGPRFSTAKPVEPAAEADRFQTTPHPRERLDLFGHGEVEKALLEAYRVGRLPQALLIGGPPGIGKATLAWRLARFLLANPNPASGTCRAAFDLYVPPDHEVTRQVVSMAHPDLFLLRREWNEKSKKLYAEIRVDDIRDAVRLFQQAPGRGGYRICLLDCAEDLNLSGANALLKLIEEPPPRSLFLIIAHMPGRLLPTIRSRCRRLSLAPLSQEDIGRVVESLGPPWADAPAADRLAAATKARGSMHDTLRLLAGRGLELDARLRSLLQALPSVDWRRVHSIADDVTQSDDRSEYDTVLAMLFDWLDSRVRLGAMATEGMGPRELAAFAEAWEKLSARARETEALNLDKRGLILSAFADLAAAAAEAVSG